MAKYHKLIGIALILVSGVIHLYNAPGELKDAPFLGVSFIVFFAGAIITAIGIYRHSIWLGWILGGLLSAGAIAGYIASRTVGLPLSGVEDWGPQNAYISMGVELLFIFIVFLVRPLKLVSKEVGPRSNAY